MDVEQGRPRASAAVADNYEFRAEALDVGLESQQQRIQLPAPRFVSGDPRLRGADGAEPGLQDVRLHDDDAPAIVRAERLQALDELGSVRCDPFSHTRLPIRAVVPLMSVGCSSTRSRWRKFLTAWLPTVSYGTTAIWRFGDALWAPLTWIRLNVGGPTPGSSRWMKSAVSPARSSHASQPE